MDWSFVSNSPIFKNLSVGEIEEVFKVIPYKIRKYSAGSIIAQSGEEVRSLRIVVSGMLKGEMTDYSGRIIKIEDIPAPNAVASAFIFGKGNRLPVNVVAVSKAELLIIDKQALLRLLMQDDRILVNFLDMISNRSQFLSEKIKFLNFKTIRGKLAQFFLQRAGDEKRSFVLDLTQNELADYFGVARPSIGRAIAEMEEQGIVEVKGKHIRIIDRKRLIDLKKL